MYHVKTQSRRRHIEDLEGRTMQEHVRRTRQENRTAATRKRLLAAAARIFARDGFEAARLEDIASSAGYTRGAFYANFTDKEDLFFALLEYWVGERMRELNALLRQTSRNPHHQLRGLRDFYAEAGKHRQLVLLSLEFTLYAIRHPAAHARLRRRRRRLRSCGTDLIRRLTPPLGHALPVRAAAASAALGAFANGVFLEHIVDPKTVTQADVRRLLRIFFDSLIGGQERNPRIKRTAFSRA
jgi:AcrR family transcriptional regulator